MWRLVHPLTSLLLDLMTFLVGAWKVLSAIRASEPGGDLDNQSFDSSLELLCCVRAVYIWTVVFVLFCFVCSFAFCLQKILPRDETRI